MPKYYISFRNNKRDYYEYLVNDKPSLEPVDGMLTSSGLIELSTKTIVNLNEHDNVLEVSFRDGSILVVDSPNVFAPQNDSNDKALEVICKNIVLYANEKAIEEYKATLPKGHTPKVNRTKSNSGKRLAVGISILAALALIAGYYNFNNVKAEQDIPDEDHVFTDEDMTTLATHVANANYNISAIEKEVADRLAMSINKDIAAKKAEEKIANPVIETQTTVTPAVKEEASPRASLAFEFSDRTSGISGKKLEMTKETCGEYIAHYASRFGLSYEIECAQIAQESPNDFKNPCQISYKWFVGQAFKVPVYDENGFTGTYDEFTVTEDMLNSLEGNIMVGLAYNRKCIDKANSYLTGIFLYNQGDPSLQAACQYFNVDISYYLGDDKTKDARDLIVNYYQALNESRGKTHGDPNYLEHVLSYLPINENGKTTVSYYLGEELVDIEICNSKILDINSDMSYNSAISR